MKRKPKSVWILFDSGGEYSGAYSSFREAKSDAWGPNFRSFEIVEYRRVPAKRLGRAKP